MAISDDVHGCLHAAWNSVSVMMNERSPRRRHKTLASFRSSLAGSSTHGRRFWSRMPTGLLIVLVVLGLVVAVVVRRLNQPEILDRVTSMSAYAQLPIGAKANTTWDSHWPTLTIGTFPARPLDQVREAYAFAARRPDIMQYIPCYCGCERFGHRSNESCYVRRRAENGSPTWSAHGVTCGICVDVTRDVAGMLADHKPLDEIRRAVDAKYLAAFGRTTATPHPALTSKQ